MDVTKEFDECYRAAKTMYEKLETMEPLKRFAVINTLVAMADFELAKLEDLEDEDGDEWKRTT